MCRLISAWSSCSRNLRESGCTFTDIAEVLLYTRWSWSPEAYLVLRNYHDSSRLVRQLCDPGTLNAVTTVTSYKSRNNIMLHFAYENIKLTASNSFLTRCEVYPRISCLSLCLSFCPSVCLSNALFVTRVCISGYPLSGYPDLSVNFMAAKNPDILK